MKEGDAEVEEAKKKKKKSQPDKPNAQPAYVIKRGIGGRISK